MFAYSYFFFSISSSGVILFFKVRDRVKKAIFTGKTIDDLNKLFMEKYPDFPR